MAIKAFRQPPPSGLMTVVRALGDLAPRGRALGGSAIDISRPLPVFRLGIDDLTEPDALDRAEFVAWRYLIEGGGGGAGMADVGEAPGGDAVFGSLARNEQADFLLQATHLAQSVADRTSQDCDVRLLQVPSLYATALWLTTDPPVFIPILDVEHPVRSVAQVRVEPEFLPRLVARAHDRRPRHSPSSSMSGP